MYNIDERLNRLSGGNLPKHPETEGFQKYAHEEYLGKNVSAHGGSFRDMSLRDAYKKRAKKARRILEDNPGI